MKNRWYEKLDSIKFPATQFRRVVPLLQNISIFDTKVPKSVESPLVRACTFLDKFKISFLISLYLTHSRVIAFNAVTRRCLAREFTAARSRGRDAAEVYRRCVRTATVVLPENTVTRERKMGGFEGTASRVYRHTPKARERKGAKKKEKSRAAIANSAAAARARHFSCTCPRSPPRRAHVRAHNAYVR